MADKQAASSSNESLTFQGSTQNKKSPAYANARRAESLPNIVSAAPRLAAFDECCISIAAWSKEQTLSWNRIKNCQEGAEGKSVC